MKLGISSQVRIADLFSFSEPEFHFTTLNTTGKEGPVSNAGYKGSSLENVSVTNGLQEWRAPLTGYYHVDMCGASGGGAKGGKGARVNGTVHLKEGTKLIVLVGQRGHRHAFRHGSGGGGSFVFFPPNSTPLGIAGGGTGEQYIRDGEPGQAGEAEGLMLGIVGYGGRLICVEPCYHWELAGVSSGGGFRGDGECFNHSLIMECNATAAKSFLNGGKGGFQYYRDCCDGGFGGGGASSRYIPGGGGGYSGGSVYVDMRSLNFKSGGGGSFVPSRTWNAETGACDRGDGYVTFRFLGNDRP